MILFFTATGNDQYVAEAIAERCGENEQALSITELLWSERRELSLQPFERFGLVTPTYFWGLPAPVVTFLEGLALDISQDPDPYTFVVATYGTTTGGLGAQTNALFQRLGAPLKARFSVKMPDTWTPIFNLSDKTAVAEKVRRGDEQAHKVAHAIAAHVTGNHMGLSVPWAIAQHAYARYAPARQCYHLAVNDACIGCGLCARQCPVRAIQMRDNRPAWVKDRCAMCLGCLHRCPVNAITYNHATQGRGQYVHPGVKLPK
ncbi:EFR1 family ferrodoxin [Olsenella sp. YH-ols2217]|uniref:EFR1 family ferrodoxin n=1 Tax=Kribbibacterium absianum TaxID=3044210 RepID=A0ABT6ZLM4_9ACTN|nr:MULTISPECIES: EFR1 family ferrodoxin [unclassified Olsenella]MDJ1121944.1 EFR1 family ferrodoxin [Olsenella sp. YH-ols2216]MDJ1129952.1 EFR1 family ferrodoxin [Olsenella sp. YH-ols2217]